MRSHGNRGIEAKWQLKVAELGRSAGELEPLQDEHADWDRRVALLRPDQIDRDLLDEQARLMLGRVHRNDLVIMTGALVRRRSMYALQHDSRRCLFV